MVPPNYASESAKVTLTSAKHLKVKAQLKTHSKPYLEYSMASFKVLDLAVQWDFVEGELKGKRQREEEGTYVIKVLFSR